MVKPCGFLMKWKTPKFYFDRRNHNRWDVYVENLIDPPNQINANHVSLFINNQLNCARNWERNIEREPFFCCQKRHMEESTMKGEGNLDMRSGSKEEKTEEIGDSSLFCKVLELGMLMHCHPSMEHLWGKFKRQNHCIPLTDTFLINHLNLMVKESTIRYAWIPVRSSFGLTWLGCDLGQTWAEPIPELTPPGSQPLHPLQSPIWKN